MDGVATTVTTAIGFLPSKVLTNGIIPLETIETIVTVAFSNSKGGTHGGSNGKGGGIGGTVTVTVTVAALVVTAPDAAESWGVNHLLT